MCFVTPNYKVHREKSSTGDTMLRNYMQMGCHISDNITINATSPYFARQE